eukprot:TRINITY_DN9594_c0_g3_i1.p1 TRINITY_DN9594_c0_g3~~TRINITY_DN9594_c0_g3_i1.p1  ORF type:complete len:339 (-),score=92.44 TRINITY_DN9594_c0_g3_i1:214-1230(-)
MSAAARAKMNNTKPRPPPPAGGSRNATVACNAHPNPNPNPNPTPSRIATAEPPSRVAVADFTGSEWVRFEIGTGVAQIILTKPEENNCMSAQMVESLASAFDTLYARTDIRIVFLTAEGRCFCAGGDPKGFQAAAQMTEQENMQSAVDFASFLHRVQCCPQFVVALVNGSCYGGGVGLVSVCDMVIATATARFTLSEVKLGVIPATISPYVIARIGVSNAKRLFCTAEAPLASVAKDYGLVNEVVESQAEFETWKRKLMDQMQCCAPNAVASAKALVMAVANRPINHELMMFTASELAKVRASKEAEAGMAALMAQPPSEPYWRTEQISLPYTSHNNE